MTVSYTVDVPAATLTPVPLDPAQIVAGAPETSLLEFDADGPMPGPETEPGPGLPTVSRGIWQLTPGVVTDVEADEMFVVVSGRATVELLDSGRVLDLYPGVVGVLKEGERTRWTVRETLRKVYQITT